VRQQISLDPPLALGPIPIPRTASGKSERRYGKKGASGSGQPEIVQVTSNFSFFSDFPNYCGILEFGAPKDSILE
jgi:hypothetical protein